MTEPSVNVNSMIRRTHATSPRPEPPTGQGRRAHPNALTALAEEYVLKSAEVALRRLHRAIADELGIEVVPPRERNRRPKERES